MKKPRQITFTFLEHDAVSKNGRVYTKAAVQDMVRRAQEDIDAGKVLSSFATHDYARTEDPTKMIGKLSRVWEDGSKVKATLDLFGTAHANDLAHIVKEQGIKTVSLRADEYETTGKKTMVGGMDCEQVSLCHLAGVDFAMRPGISMVNIDPVTYESDETGKPHRDIVACENDPRTVILTEEEADMTKEEAEVLFKQMLAADKAAAQVDERTSHAHPHEHEGGDGKKYKHEHKHAHDESDKGCTEHMHDHGNPYEDLGAYSLADLAKAVSERLAVYATDGTPALVMEGAAKHLVEATAVLTKAGLIKESVVPEKALLTEEVAKTTILSESVAALTKERDAALAKVTETEAAKTVVEAEAEDLAKKLLEAARPGGRRVPIGQIVEQALAEVGVKRPDDEVPTGKEYAIGIRAWSASLAASEFAE